MSFTKEVALAKRQIEITSGDLLPHPVQNRALALFKKTRKPLKGKNFETFVGACVFIACREQGIAIHTLAKSKLFSWKDAKLVRYYKEICNYLEINLPPDKAINNVEWIGKRVEYRMDEETLKLPGTVIREATKLLSKVPGSETGSNPVGIAAAMLYIISVTSGYPFTQKQFAEAAKINSQTITKSAKRLNGIIKKNKLGKYVDHNTRYHRIV
jgi:transcription initiation factor TFIIIB Brf1 subunit/transcription initiation factor TFIIB